MIDADTWVATVRATAKDDPEFDQWATEALRHVRTQCPALPENPADLLRVPTEGGYPLAKTLLDLWEANNPREPHCSS